MITHNVIVKVPQKNGQDQIYLQKVEFETKEQYELWKRKNPFKWKHVSEWGQMPTWHYADRFTGSDVVFIENQLVKLGEHNRAVACSDYDVIYLRDGRKAANEFLLEFCKEYGITKIEYRQASLECELPEHLKIRIAELRNLKKRSRSKYSHIFMD